MTLVLVDFHCHLDLYPDFEDAIKESERSGIYTLAVTTTPRAWKRNYELTKDLQHVRPALGLHPQLVGNNTAKELILWEKALPQAKYIGEVGLDASPGFFHTLDEQKKVFKHVLTSCATAGNKILSVHAVRSATTVLDMVETFLPRDRGVVVLHWFTGTPAQARRAVELGCYFSINAPMLHSQKGRTLISQLPLDRLLTETDGPFTNHYNNMPRHTAISQTLHLLSKALDVTPLAITQRVATNLKNLLTSPA